MKYFTSADKLALWQFLNTGYLVYELAYDPNNATPVNPETTATQQGWTEYYREASGNLVEVIYTKPSSGVITTVPSQANF